MKFAIIYSKKDPAGVNIAEQLKSHFLPQTVLIELNKESVYAESIDKDERVKGCEFLIFASKHQSKTGNPSLSVHSIGNWRSADFGGKNGKLGMTSAQASKYLFQKLNENANNTKHKITLEVTHHGPYTEKPTLFIEIGSTEEQWGDKTLGKIIAKTISDFQNFEPNKKLKTALGIGGPHYSPNFNKIQLANNDIAIGHILPEHHLPATESIIEEAIKETKEHIDFVILDWKGCGISESRQQLINLIEKMGLKWMRSDKIKKN